MSIRFLPLLVTFALTLPAGAQDIEDSCKNPTDPADISYLKTRYTAALDSKGGLRKSGLIKLREDIIKRQSLSGTVCSTNEDLAKLLEVVEQDAYFYNLTYLEQQTYNFCNDRRDALETVPDGIHFRDEDPSDPYTRQELLYGRTSYMVHLDKNFAADGLSADMAAKCEMIFDVDKDGRAHDVEGKCLSDPKYISEESIFERVKISILQDRFPVKESGGYPAWRCDLTYPAYAMAPSEK
ncbi:MAG: hypothetical protein AAGI14_06215 [Pseudomonadota bacterium]